MKPLNSDDLGRYGEDTFAGLCSAVGLFANRSNPDRTGWDFLIEFPFEPAEPGIFLDQRPAPPDCKAQVKTAWEGATSFRMRLSAAERLAKVDQPVCLFILCILPDLSIGSMFAIHILDDFLSYILLQVRKCQAKNALLINKMKVNIRFMEYATKLDPTGLSVRDYIRHINGIDRAQYVLRKRSQIQNLGVVGSRFSGEFSIKATDHDELAEILLGKRSARFVSLWRQETRWEIPLELPDIGQTGTLNFFPKAKLATLYLRSEGPINRGTIIAVDVTVASSGNQEAQVLKILMKNELVEILVTVMGGIGNLHCDFGSDRPLTLAQHRKRNLLRILMSEDGKFTLKDRQKRTIFYNRYQSQAPEGTSKLCEDLEKVLEQLSVLVSMAGDSEDQVQLCLDDVDRQLSILGFLSGLMTAMSRADLGDFVITDPENKLPPLDENLAVLVVGQVRLGADTLVFGSLGSAKLTKSKNVTLGVRQLELRRIEMRGHDSNLLCAFGDEMKAETGVSLLISLGAVHKEAA